MKSSDAIEKVLSERGKISTAVVVALDLPPGRMPKAGQILPGFRNCVHLRQEVVQRAGFVQKPRLFMGDQLRNSSNRRRKDYSFHRHRFHQSYGNSFTV